MVSALFAAALAAALAFAFVGLVRADALRRGLIDRPNERSSHAVPTPRGGGLGLLVALAIALLVQVGAARAFAQWPAALAVALVAVVGWLDDHRGAPVRLRLVVHVAAGALLLPLARAAAFGLPGETIGLPPLLLLACWWVLWTVSAINVINFVDGIDGIIGLQVLVYGAYLACVGDADGAARAFGFALAGASAGFLAWNWSPARIFLGDVGSGALGVVAVIGGLLLLREGRVGFVAAYLPLAPIFLDAAVTLVRRARRGARLSQAHRTHLYQRLANGGQGHARVSIAFAVPSVILAAAAAYVPRSGGLLLVIAVAALSFVGALAERRAQPFPPG